MPAGAGSACAGFCIELAQGFRADHGTHEWGGKGDVHAKHGASFSLHLCQVQQRGSRQLCTAKRSAQGGAEGEARESRVGEVQAEGLLRARGCRKQVLGLGASIIAQLSYLWEKPRGV